MPVVKGFVYVLRLGEGQLSPLMLPYRILEEATQSDFTVWKPAPAMLVKGVGKSSDHGIWAFWYRWNPDRQEDEKQVLQSCMAWARWEACAEWHGSAHSWSAGHWEGCNPPNSSTVYWAFSIENVLFFSVRKFILVSPKWWEVMTISLSCCHQLLNSARLAGNLSFHCNKAALVFHTMLKKITNRVLKPGLAWLYISSECSSKRKPY